METIIETYMSLLPIELIVEIFKYTKTEDVINFCAAFGEFQQRGIIKKIDLAHNYKVDVKALPININCDHVTSVNLNHCHWVPKTILHNFISQLKNVKVLSALETNLGLTASDIEIYNKIKLHKLAVTLTDKENPTSAFLETVSALYLEITEESAEYFEGDFNKNVNLAKVHTIWLKHLADEQYPTDEWLSNCPNLKSLTVWLHSIGELLPDKWKSNKLLRKFYEPNHMFWPRIVCYEKSEGRMPEWNPCEDFNVPFSPKDAKKLYFGQESFGTIKFKELFFCTSQNLHIYREILKTHSEFIENLAINDESDGCALNSMLDDFDHLKHVKHLSIFMFDNVCPNYHYISKMTNLESLHLEIPPFVDASFLPAVLQNCRSLQKLTINLLRHSNPQFCTHLNEAFGNADNLKEFLFQCHDELFDIDNIISGVKGIKLQKLWLFCSPAYMNADLWKEYFTLNEQLMDCLIVGNLTCEQELVKELNELYQRPYRKLQFGNGSAFYVNFETEIFDRTPCGMIIDDDFFMNN